MRDAFGEGRIGSNSRIILHQDAGEGSQPTLEFRFTERRSRFNARLINVGRETKNAGTERSNFDREIIGFFMIGSNAHGHRDRLHYSDFADGNCPEEDFVPALRNVQNSIVHPGRDFRGKAERDRWIP